MLGTNKVKAAVFSTIFVFLFFSEENIFLFSVSESPESNSTYINLTNTKVLRKKLLSCFIGYKVTNWFHLSHEAFIYESTKQSLAIIDHDCERLT